MPTLKAMAEHRWPSFPTGGINAGNRSEAAGTIAAAQGADK
jgi:hypothetical protein